MSFLLYGIIAGGGLADVSDESLLFIPAAGLLAVATVCEQADQDMESVLAYGRRVEHIHAQTTIIPMRYGTLLPDETAVAEHVSVMAEHYRHRLVELAGCEEMGIRLPMAKPETDSVPVLPTTSGRDYLRSLKRKYSATEQAENQAAALNLALAGLYRKQRAETGVFNGETMYLVSYLVSRDRLVAFRDKLDELVGSGNLEGLISGPWPPYNFA